QSPVAGAVVGVAEVDGTGRSPHGPAAPGAGISRLPCGEEGGPQFLVGVAVAPGCCAGLCAVAWLALAHGSGAGVVVLVPELLAGVAVAHGRLPGTVKAACPRIRACDRRHIVSAQCAGREQARREA